MPAALGRLGLPPLSPPHAQPWGCAWFSSQTQPPWTLPRSCSHQVLCLHMSELLGLTEFKSFSQKYYSAQGQVGRSWIPGYRSVCAPPAHGHSTPAPAWSRCPTTLLSFTFKTLSDLTPSAFLSLPPERRLWKKQHFSLLIEDIHTFLSQRLVFYFILFGFLLSGVVSIYDNSTLPTSTPIHTYHFRSASNAISSLYM